VARKVLRFVLQRDRLSITSDSSLGVFIVSLLCHNIIQCGFAPSRCRMIMKLQKSPNLLAFKPSFVLQVDLGKDFRQI